jgi:hypothetical protein
MNVADTNAHTEQILAQPALKISPKRRIFAIQKRITYNAPTPTGDILLAAGCTCWF